MDLQKPLRRTVDDRMVAGVLGGIAQWLRWDPTLVRTAYVLLTILSVGLPGVVAYLILYFVIPPEDTI